MDIKQVITPESQGVWIASTFIVALLALVVAFASLKRTNSVIVGTQAQVMVLNQKIQELKAGSAAAPAVAAAEAPAAK